MFTRPRCFKHPMVHFCSLKCKGFDFVNHHHRSVNRSYLGSRFFGEFLPAGEIWTNTSQWTKSTFYEKKSLENIKEILFNQVKHTWNTIWLALQYGQTNPSRIRREVGLPREISLFSFPLWSRHRMEEFWGQTQSWKSYSHLEQIRYPKIFTSLCRVVCHGFRFLPQIDMLENDQFPPKWPFSSMSPRVAKGHQGSPMLSKVQGGPQGWVRWVLTRSIIFKSFSYMIFKMGPFPHWNSN